MVLRLGPPGIVVSNLLRSVKLLGTVRGELERIAEVGRVHIEQCLENAVGNQAGTAGPLRLPLYSSSYD